MSTAASAPSISTIKLPDQLRSTQHHTVRRGVQARLVDCAEEATSRFLRGLGMDIGHIDLLVPAPSAADFLDP